MATNIVIDYPVLNSPFKERARHFRFSDEGITNQIVEARRVNFYFIPIPPVKKKGKESQLAFRTDWTQDRIQENVTINRIRERVGIWCKGGYLGVTRTTHRLLDYWNNPELAEMDGSSCRSLNCTTSYPFDSHKTGKTASGASPLRR